ncbi:MAG: hypothetical protein [brine shrimp arlivirus 5]|nr:MAG: hypothetical protein [brine shrimp arlivirus 5]
MANRNPQPCNKNDQNAICQIDCKFTHYKFTPPNPTDPGYSAWLESRLKALKDNQRVMMNNLCGDHCAMSESLMYLSKQIDALKDQVANLAYFRGVSQVPPTSLARREAYPTRQRELDPPIQPVATQNFSAGRRGRPPTRGNRDQRRSKSAHYSSRSWYSEGYLAQLQGVPGTNPFDLYPTPVDPLPSTPATPGEPTPSAAKSQSKPGQAKKAAPTSRASQAEGQAGNSTQALPPQAPGAGTADAGKSEAANDLQRQFQEAAVAMQNLCITPSPAPPQI